MWLAAMCDERRLSARARGYTRQWEKARSSYLARHPLCVMCERDGRTTPSTVVDHIVPHRGDQALFWNQSNWQALCKTHHDGDKQRLEKSGRVIGCDADGFPIDDRHHWR